MEGHRPATIGSGCPAQLDSHQHVRSGMSVRLYDGLYRTLTRRIQTGPAPWDCPGRRAMIS